MTAEVVELPKKDDDGKWNEHIIVTVEIVGRNYRMDVNVQLTGEESNPGVPMLMGLNAAINAVLKDAQQAIVDRYPPEPIDVKDLN